MHNIRYSTEQRGIIAGLIGASPRAVYYDGVMTVTLDCGEHHIVASPTSLRAATQHDADEAIQVRLELREDLWDGARADRLGIPVLRITGAWILRTVLYFTDRKHYDSPQEAIQSAGIADSTPTGKQMQDLIAGARSGYSEVTCHPGSETARRLNPRYANLLEAGVLLAQDDRFLVLAPDCNTFFLREPVVTAAEVEEGLLSVFERLEVPPDRAT